MITRNEYSSLLEIRRKLAKPEDFRAHRLRKAKLAVLQALEGLEAAIADYEQHRQSILSDLDGFLLYHSAIASDDSGGVVCSELSDTANS